MTQSLTYVYCLLRSTRRPVLRDVPPGMPGAQSVRALEAGGGLWAVVSSVPPRSYDESALAGGLSNLDWVGRRAIAHEAVVEHFLSATAVLPMQLFTLFTSDERALEHVGRDRPKIDRILSRIERQLEWGLRLAFDENAARQAVDQKHSSAKMPIHTRAAASGSAYLTRKRDLLDVTRARIGEAKTEADQLYRAMSREATEARRRTATEQAAPGSRLLLDAAFLVPARRAGAFRTALRRNARKLGATGIVVSLTGPWPPYNFIAPSSRDALRRGTSTPSPEGLRRGKSAPRDKRPRRASKRR